MLTIISQFWLDLLVMLAAGSMIFIGWVSVKKYHFYHHENDSSTPLIDQSDIAIPPCLSEPVSDHLAPSRIHLRLKNTGKRFRYQGLSIQADNEIRVEISEQLKYNQYVEHGDEITFLLMGTSPGHRTYHFRVIFSDEQGNTYSQGVAGWGMIHTLLEEPMDLQV